jgi:hypothetical protein
MVRIPHTPALYFAGLGDWFKMSGVPTFAGGYPTGAAAAAPSYLVIGG